MSADKKEPTVKINPDFEIGEIVTHLGEGTDHKIQALKTVEKIVRLEGLVAWLPLHIITKKI